MFFSVIVPVYNVAPYLRKCLDSLAGQTCTDKEIILIDDGSTDGSGEICDEYAAQYPFVTVVHQENQGVSGARNTGIEHAEGEWLSFVDSDDWVDTDMLERLQGYILATDADMYCIGFEYVNSEGVRTGEGRIKKRNTIASFNNECEQFLFYFYEHHSFQRTCNGIYRRDIIQEHQLSFIDHRKVFSEDTFFNYSYFLYTHKVVLLCDMPYHYRQREGSLCTATSAEEKILRCTALGEYAYRAVVEQGMTYFQQNFHKHYFLFINVYSLCFRNITNGRLRQLLNEMGKKELHRTCIMKMRVESDYFTKYTKNRVWFDENFGKEGDI